MTWKNYLTTCLSAFIGGVCTYASAHLGGGLPTTTQAVEAFLAGAAVTGLAAVVHLYVPVPEPASKENAK